MADQQALARALLEKLDQFSTFLDELFAKVVKKVGNQIKASKRFFEMIIENAKELAKTVNPVGAIAKSVRFILDIFDTLKNRLRLLRKLLSKIIDMLRRGMNNLAAVLGKVTKLLKRFVTMFREFLGDIIRLAIEAQVVQRVLSLISQMRRVLQLVFRWIDGVTGASSAVRALAKVLKKLMKSARLILRQLKTVPKEVRALAKA